MTKTRVSNKAKKTLNVEPGDTLANVLRRQIADEILAGIRPPESRLDERRLAEEYSVSRTPVREALQQLVQQLQLIGSGSAGPQAAQTIRQAAAQQGVWSLGNFGGAPPAQALSAPPAAQPDTSSKVQ